MVYSVLLAVILSFSISKVAKLGRFPLIIGIYKNILHNILYLLRKNEDNNMAT